MATCIRRLTFRARRADVPIVYVNDNFGRWRSDFRRLVAHCARAGGRGRAVARALRPDSTDYFVLEPKHSGFYSTSLGLLLDHLGARTLIRAARGPARRARHCTAPSPQRPHLCPVLAKPRPRRERSPDERQAALPLAKALARRAPTPEEIAKAVTGKRPSRGGSRRRPRSPCAWSCPRRARAAERVRCERGASSKRSSRRSSKARPSSSPPSTGIFGVPPCTNGQPPRCCLSL